MNKGLTLIGGVGLGAALMYVLDPDKGRRRRVLMRNQATHSIHKTMDALDTTARDLRNRLRGLGAGTSALGRSLSLLGLPGGYDDAQEISAGQSKTGCLRHNDQP